MNRREEIELMQKQIVQQIRDVREKQEKPLNDKWLELECERLCMEKHEMDAFRKEIKNVQDAMSKRIGRIQFL